MTSERQLTTATNNPAIMLGRSVLFLARCQLRTMLPASAAGFTLMFVIVPDDPMLRLVAASAPSLVLVFVAIHETAHWYLVKRRVRSAPAGALVSSGTKIFLRRPELHGADLLAVSLAGPLSAGLIASAGAVASHDRLPLFVVFATVAVAQFSALTPCTRDGRDIAAALSPPS